MKVTVEHGKLLRLITFEFSLRVKGGHASNRSYVTIEPVRSRVAGREKRGMMKSRRESCVPVGNTGHSMKAKT